MSPAQRLGDTWHRHWAGIAFACAFLLSVAALSLLQVEGLAPNQASTLWTILAIAVGGMAAAALAWAGARLFGSWRRFPGALVIALLLLAATVVGYEKFRWREGSYSTESLVSQISSLEQKLSQTKASDAALQAATLQHLGDAETKVGRLAEAVYRYREALELYQRVGDKRGVAASLTSLSALGQTSGKYESAEAEADRAIIIYRELGDKIGEANALASLGRLFTAEGKYAESLATLRKADMQYQSAGSKEGNLTTRLDEALVLSRSGEQEEAMALLRATFNEALDRKNWLIAANASAALGDLLSNPPAKASAYDAAAELYQRAGAIESARTSLNKARQLAPGRPVSTAVPG